MVIRAFCLDNKKTATAVADARRIIHFVKTILNEEKFTLKRLNIVIADDNYLRKMNLRFLNRNRVTNVISFNLGDISEIYVSKERAADTWELYYYIVHGLLHIIGYDHRRPHEQQKMEKRCLKYLGFIKNMANKGDSRQLPEKKQ